MTMTRDEAIAYVRRWNAEFHGDGNPAEEPEEQDGILLWRVGRNASHEFYAGVGPDGTLYQKALGEDDFDELDAIPAHLSDEAHRREVNRVMAKINRDNTRRVESFGGYYGHF